MDSQDFPSGSSATGPGPAHGGLETSNDDLRLGALNERTKLRLDALLDRLKEGVIVLDARGEILIMNPAAREILGLASGGASDLSDLRDIARHYPDGRPMPFEEAPIVRVYRGEEIGLEEVVIGDGRHVTISASCICDDNGNIINAILTSRDVTHLRELEKLRDEYLALVSHDLRGPLAIIFGAARRLAASELSSETQASETIDLITESASRLETLIADLMEYRLLESGDLELHKEPMSLIPFAREVVRRSVPVADQGRIRVSADGDLQPILADKERLERVFANLLSNAVKYSPEDSPIDLTVLSSDDEVLCSIRDRGSGIPADDLAHIFDRFRRLEHGEATAKGFGLGLYICQQIVKAHGGRIWATSEPGAGSEFSFSLPATQWMDNDVAVADGS